MIRSLLAILLLVLASGLVAAAERLTCTLIASGSLEDIQAALAAGVDPERQLGTHRSMWPPMSGAPMWCPCSLLPGPTSRPGPWRV